MTTKIQISVLTMVSATQTRSSKDLLSDKIAWNSYNPRPTLVNYRQFWVFNDAFYHTQHIMYDKCCNYGIEFHQSIRTVNQICQ